MARGNLMSLIRSSGGLSMSFRSSVSSSSRSSRRQGVSPSLKSLGNVVVVGAAAVEGAPLGHRLRALGPALDALEALLRQAVLDAAAGL
eukprot:3581513-Pyramimonas_sp.AAC.1